jgi:hypothetical protein
MNGSSSLPVLQRAFDRVRADLSDVGLLADGASLGSTRHPRDPGGQGISATSPESAASSRCDTSSLYKMSDVASHPAHLH